MRTAVETALDAARRAGRFGPVVHFPPGAPVILRDFTTPAAARAGAGAYVGGDGLPPGSFDIGKWNERRTGMYETTLFEDEGNSVEGFAGRRDIHVGIDIGGVAGTPVLAFDDGMVLHCGYNPATGDYGHVIVTSHEIMVAPGRAADQQQRSAVSTTIYALYGHLSAQSIEGKEPGMAFHKGTVLGWIGGPSENGACARANATCRPSTADRSRADSSNSLTLNECILLAICLACRRLAAALALPAQHRQTRDARYARRRLHRRPRSRSAYLSRPAPRAGRAL